MPAARKGEDARVDALMRSVLRCRHEALLTPRPEAAARVVLDAVRLGRVRPDQTGRLVGEGAASLRALEARGGRRVALDVLLLVRPHFAEVFADGPLALHHSARREGIAAPIP